MSKSKLMGQTSMAKCKALMRLAVKGLIGLAGVTVTVKSLCELF